MLCGCVSLLKGAASDKRRTKKRRRLFPDNLDWCQESRVFLHSKCSAWDVVSLRVGAAGGYCWRSWTMLSGALTLHCCMALPVRRTRHKPGWYFSFFSFFFFFMGDFRQIFILESCSLIQIFHWRQFFNRHFSTYNNLYNMLATMCWISKLSVCTDSEWRVKLMRWLISC